MLDDFFIAVFRSVQFIAELTAELFHWLRSDDTEND